ncbi:chemokine (C-X-C motif) ligand 20 [Salminus brasiliensis]|uniref:chemokine (C-X-C motif) ligand 20 n=1 Tax=Salminus brasiliensis TaxID=930266 RepID=UPI003B831F3F
MQAMTAILFLVIFGMTATLCAGRVGGQGERCLCKGRLLKRVRPKVVETFQPFYPSASCSKTEILIKLKIGKHVCLDPNGKQGKRMLQGKIGKRSKAQGGKRQKKKQE